MVGLSTIEMFCTVILFCFSYRNTRRTLAAVIVSPGDHCQQMYSTEKTRTQSYKKRVLNQTRDLGCVASRQYYQLPINYDAPWSCAGRLTLAMTWVMWTMTQESSRRFGVGSASMRRWKSPTRCFTLLIAANKQCHY